MATTEDWHEIVANDLETYPEDGALVEVEFENGACAQASFSRKHFNLRAASTEIAGGTAPKRWRYLKSR
jgi:hypothetical protein